MSNDRRQAAQTRHKRSIYKKRQTTSNSVTQKRFINHSAGQLDAATTPPLLLFNKPYGVLCQFTDSSQRVTLADYLEAPGYYPAGRLDRDSEGLMILTNNGKLQQRISDPRYKWEKTYLVQVEGNVDPLALRELQDGITLKDGPAAAISARQVDCPEQLWPRDPPVRFRKQIPTSWIEVSLREGRNRQVRRMTAAVGFPTLRLIRTRIGNFQVWPLALGKHVFSNTDGSND